MAESRIIRGLGEPAIFTIIIGGVVAALYVALGAVAEDALGLTPVVFLIAAVFLVTTILTYVEGSSLHTERGGASSSPAMPSTSSGASSPAGRSSSTTSS